MKNGYDYNPYRLKGGSVGMLVVGALVAGSWLLPALGQYNRGTPATAGPEYDLSWHTVDGGGVMFSAGDDYELSGTIGQPDAGALANGDYELTGGFWFALAPGDCNTDGGVNLFDHDSFVACMDPSGPDGGVPPSCTCFDLDDDGDIDLNDFGLFMRQFTGPE